jgi:DNA-binding transcriptional regulator YiaG
LNNHIDNLQWGTDQENADDRLRHGTQVRGEKQHLAKLNAADVLEIRRLWDTTRIQQKELAERFNTTQANISMVVLRKTWIHI